MSLVPGRGGEDDEVERQKKAKQEMQVSKDALGTNKLEAALVNENREEQENTRNQLLDPEEDKQRLKQLLLNVKPVEKQQYAVMCNQCGTQYTGEPDICEECGNNESFETVKAGTTVEWVKRSEESLLNNNGFHKVVWSEIEPAISSTVAGGYLKSHEVSKLNYSTLSTVTMQLALYPWRYGVDNPSDMQEIGDILRPILIGHTSKARGGRGLESTERTVMEKISRAITGSEEDDENENVIF